MKTIYTYTYVKMVVVHTLLKVIVGVELLPHFRAKVTGYHLSKKKQSKTKQNKTKQNKYIVAY